MADKYVSSNQFFIGVQRIISLMNGKIGDVSLNTTDQTINGAINENVASIKALQTKIDNLPSTGGTSPSVDLTPYVKKTELSTVATSGSYNDLKNKPTIPSISGLASETFVTDKINEAKLSGGEVDLSPYVKSADLSTVAKSGSYNDLTNKPTIPTVPTLSKVATSGSYNDLNNKPTIPSISGLASESFVTNAINEAKLSGSGSEIDLSIYVKSSDLSSVATSGSYLDLTDKPYIPTDPDLTPYTKKTELSKVATSGSYNDLTNKPTIPTIPSLATVATSGSYDDLTNKPTILTEDQVRSIVLSQVSTTISDALNAEY